MPCVAGSTDSTTDSTNAESRLRTSACIPAPISSDSEFRSLGVNHSSRIGANNDSACARKENPTRLARGVSARSDPSLPNGAAD